MIKKPWNHEGKLSYTESFKWILITATLVVAFSAFFNQSTSLSSYPPLVSSIVVTLVVLHLSLLNITMLKEILTVLSLNIIKLIKQPLNLKALIRLNNHYIEFKERVVQDHIYLKLRVFRI